MSEQVKENPEKYYWTNKDFQEGVEEIPLVTKDTPFTSIKSRACFGFTTSLLLLQAI